MSKKNVNGTENLARLEQSNRAGKKNLAEWRASRVHEMELPSGLEVMLRDVDMPSIMMEGNLPNTLTDLITSESFQSLSEEEAGKAIVANNADFNKLMMIVIKTALAKPLLGDSADDDHILYSELTFNDKMFIFNFVNREADELRPFREGESEPGTPA